MKILALIAALFLAACGTDGKPGKDGVPGKNGTNGVDGKNGVDGTNGKDGTNGDIVLLERIKDIYTKHRQSVYRITVQCNGVAYSFGSGFRINTNTVATNKHITNFSCSSGTKRFKIEAVYDYLDTLKTGSYLGNGDCPAGESKYCQISNLYSQSSSWDLAKITVGAEFVGGPVTIDSHTSTVGTQLLSMSFPLAFEDLYTLTGSVSSNYLGDCHGGSVYGCPGIYYDFISNLDTDHGSSGSPIFNLMTGKVVGITTAGTDGENMNTTWAIFANKLSGF